MHCFNRVLLAGCLLSGVLRAQGNLEVIAAYYGADRNFVDVTSSTRSQAQPTGLGFVVGSDSLGGDPFPGQIKTLRLYYKLGGVFQQDEWKAAANFRGAPTCVAFGQNPAQLTGTFGSLKLLGNVRQVELFESANFAGRSLRLTADIPDLTRATSGFFGSPVTWAPNPGAFRMIQ